MVQFYQGSGFIACSKYPDCDWKRFMNQAEESKIIGYDPQTEQSIVSKEGRYGKYLEWSANDEYKEKRISIPTLLKNNDMNLELALESSQIPQNHLPTSRIWPRNQSWFWQIRPILTL